MREPGGVPWKLECGVLTLADGYKQVLGGWMVGLPEQVLSFDGADAILLDLILNPTSERNKQK